MAAKTPLRQRAGDRFDAADYKHHCEYGGHPTPAGILTLNGPTFAQPELIAVPAVQSYEVVLHGLAACDYLTHAIPKSVPEAEPLLDRAHQISADWRANDPAALFTTTGGRPEREAALAIALAEGMVELTARAAEWRGIDLRWPTVSPGYGGPGLQAILRAASPLWILGRNRR